MKIEYVKAHTVKDYFALPKEERYKWGFLYRKPRSMIWDMQNKDEGWEKRIKELHPVQHFFRETVWDAIQDWRISFRTKWRAVHRIFKPSHPRFQKVYPRHRWQDCSHTMVEAVVAIVLDFYYEEFLKGCTDWENTSVQHARFAKELEECVKFFESVAEQHGRKWCVIEPNVTIPELVADYTEESTLKDDVEKWLVWAIRNKDYMWT